MASAVTHGPGPPVKCPYCDEELIKDEDDGQYPESCPECGEDLPADLGGPMLVCPHCAKKRTKRPKGGYAKFCTTKTCKYNFETGQLSGTGSTPVHSHTPERITSHKGNNSLQSHSMPAASSIADNQSIQSLKQDESETPDKATATKNVSAKEPQSDVVTKPADGIKRSSKEITDDTSSDRGKSGETEQDLGCQRADGRKEAQIDICTGLSGQPTGVNQNSSKMSQSTSENTEETMKRHPDTSTTTGEEVEAQIERIHPEIRDSKVQANNDRKMDGDAERQNGKDPSGIDSRTTGATTDTKTTYAGTVHQRKREQTGEIREEAQFGIKAKVTGIHDVGTQKRKIGNDKETTPPQRDEDSDLYDEFCVWEKKVADIKSNQDFQQKRLNKNERQAVVSAVQRLDSLKSQYQQAQERKKSEILAQMRTLVNMWSKPGSLVDMAQRKFSAHLEQLNISQKQVGAIPKSALRKTTFWAVLPETVKKRIANKKLLPTIEVRSNYDTYQWSSGSPLTTLTESDYGIWKGETLGIAKQQKTLEYKYALKDSRSQLIWEVLFQNNNRVVNFSEDEQVIYDGAIIIDSKQLHNFFTFDRDEQVDRQAGFLKMLPQWIREMRNGKSLDELLHWVESATSRQLLCFLGGNAVPTVAERTDARDPTHQILVKYVIDQAKELQNSLVSHIVSSNVALMSMLGLVHIVTQSFQLLNYYPLAITFSSLFEAVMTELSRRPAEMTVEAVIQSLDSLMKSRFSTALLLALRHMAHLTTCKSWITLLPLFHLLSNAKETRGKYYRTANWWGTGGFDHEVQRFKQQRHSDDSWRTWLNQLSPFFVTDTVLPYTFLALLDQRNFINFLSTSEGEQIKLPLDGVLACAICHLTRATVHSTRQNILVAMNGWLKRFQLLNVQGSGERQLLGHLVAELLQPFRPFQYMDCWKDALTVAEIFLHVSALYLDDVELLKTDHFNPLLHFLRNEATASAELISRPHTVSRLNHEFLLWEDQFRCQASHSEVNQLWTKCCQDKFSSRIHQMNVPSLVADRVIKGAGFAVPAMNVVADEYFLSIPEWWLQVNKK